MINIKIHELKILSEYFNAVKSESKNFEIRKNDRDFQVGDVLILKEITFPDINKNIYYFTGQTISRKITYIFKDDTGSMGLNKNYAILGIKPMDK